MMAQALPAIAERRKATAGRRAQGTGQAIDYIKNGLADQDKFFKKLTDIIIWKMDFRQNLQT